MNDLISRSALDLELQSLVKEYNRNCESDKSSGAFEALYRLRLAPSVDAETVFEAAGLVKEAFDMAKADLVAVVRCKDCKWLYSGFDTYSCAKHTGLALIKPDGSGFCSYGERRAVE